MCVFRLTEAVTVSFNRRRTGDQTRVIIDEQQTESV